MMSTFLSIFFESEKQHWAGGMGEKGSHCPMLLSEIQSQPKVSGHPQKKALPRFPSFNVAPMMSTFLSIFFESEKQHWAGGIGGKGSHCPMLLSEIVAFTKKFILRIVEKEAYIQFHIYVCYAIRCTFDYRQPDPANDQTVSTILQSPVMEQT